MAQHKLATFAIWRPFFIYFFLLDWDSLRHLCSNGYSITGWQKAIGIVFAGRQAQQICVKLASNLINLSPLNFSSSMIVLIDRRVSMDVCASAGSLRSSYFGPPTSLSFLPRQVVQVAANFVPLCYMRCLRDVSSTILPY